MTYILSTYLFVHSSDLQISTVVDGRLLSYATRVLCVKVPENAEYRTFPQPPGYFCDIFQAKVRPNFRDPR